MTGWLGVSTFACPHPPYSPSHFFPVCPSQIISSKGLHHDSPAGGPAFDLARMVDWVQPPSPPSSRGGSEGARGSQVKRNPRGKNPPGIYVRRRVLGWIRGCHTTDPPPAHGGVYHFKTNVWSNPTHKSHPAPGDQYSSWTDRMTLRATPHCLQDVCLQDVMTHAE